ncbi:MAG TPA: hypothetical protein VK845_12495 [Gemmatimonadales bacterium]|nr:hypothetical protein [Gemmatimonadales bacterium]
MPSTPDNAGYMIAAYVITVVVYVGYTISLWRRARLLLRSEDD